MLLHESESVDKVDFNHLEWALAQTFFLVSLSLRTDSNYSSINQRYTKNRNTKKADKSRKFKIFQKKKQKKFVSNQKRFTFATLKKGEVAERSNAAVLKTVEGNTSGGSNPSFSAK